MRHLVYLKMNNYAEPFKRFLANFTEKRQRDFNEFYQLVVTTDTISGDIFTRMMEGFLNIPNSLENKTTLFIEECQYNPEKSENVKVHFRKI